MHSRDHRVSRWGGERKQWETKGQRLLSRVSGVSGYGSDGSARAAARFGRQKAKIRLKKATTGRISLPGGYGQRDTTPGDQIMAHRRGVEGGKLAWVPEAADSPELFPPRTDALPLCHSDDDFSTRFLILFAAHQEHPAVVPVPFATSPYPIGYVVFWPLMAMGVEDWTDDFFIVEPDGENVRYGWKIGVPGQA